MRRKPALPKGALTLDDNDCLRYPTNAAAYDSLVGHVFDCKAGTRPRYPYKRVMVTSIKFSPSGDMYVCVVRWLASRGTWTDAGTAFPVRAFFDTYKKSAASPSP